MDLFTPHWEPARSIYDAFQEEATKRKTRSVEDWVQAERAAVHKAACVAAQKEGLPEPTMEEIQSAETYAMGSVDYGATWAYRIVDLARKRASQAAKSTRLGKL